MTKLPGDETTGLLSSGWKPGLDLATIKQEEDEEVGFASPISSIFNLINTTIGAGILALPLAIQQCGMILGVFLTFFVGILCSYSLHCLLVASKLTRKYSYKDLAVQSIGKWAGPLFEANIICLCFGVCTVYVILISRMFPPLIGTLTGHPEAIYSNMYFVTGMLMLFIVLPLSMLKRIQFLSTPSMLAIIAILYVVILVAVRFFVKMGSPDGGLRTRDIIWINFDGISILSAIPTLIFAFGSHITLLPVYKELKNRTSGKMSHVINISVLSCITLYIIIGVTGYLENMEVFPFSDAILDLYPQDDVSVIIGRILIGLVVILSYPLVHFALRNGIEKVFFPCWGPNLFRWIAIALFNCVITYLLGVFIRRIVVVFGLVMTTAGALIEYDDEDDANPICYFYLHYIIFFHHRLIFPFWIYVMVEKSKSRKIIASIVMVFAGIISIICFVLAVMSTVKDVIEMFHPPVVNPCI